MLVDHISEFSPPPALPWCTRRRVRFWCVPELAGVLCMRVEGVFENRGRRLDKHVVSLPFSPCPFLIDRSHLRCVWFRTDQGSPLRSHRAAPHPVVFPRRGSAPSASTTNPTLHTSTPCGVVIARSSAQTIERYLPGTALIMSARDLHKPARLRGRWA